AAPEISRDGRWVVAAITPTLQEREKTKNEKGIKKDKDKDKNMVNLGFYYLGDDFEAKFWKEMFKGGGPGMPGNTLMAVGQGFIFKRAVLESVGAPSESGYEYATTYVGGDLILNSSGPWLNKGKLKDTGIMALNHSISNETTGNLKFHLVFGGQFDDTGYFYRVDAWYDGEPRMSVENEGGSGFQRGSDFEDIIIQIAEEPIEGVPDGDEDRPGRINPGTYSTCEPDFNTKFWKEKFKGGGPGQPGNVLKAIGDGFVFKHAKINEDGAQEIEGEDNVYMTTYTGGKLTLNSSGPWLNKGQLKARDIEAVNLSTWDEFGLHFELRFEGMFQDTGIYFKVLAWYDGMPEMKGWGNTSYEFQRGTDFHAKIIISETEITEKLMPECDEN
ncbi:MAG: hypothetical protein ACERK6_12980, partial [Candidatus Aminicenantaceae bacterium]